MAYLDELGRTYRTEQQLGSDYSDKSLVTSRQFDDLGRVTFEADPYLSTLEGKAHYGTTYHFAPDGALSCSIRGYGRQPLTFSSDLKAELFPTCITRTFSNHQVQVSVNKPDALLAGSPQAGVTYTDTMTAIGWVIQRETVRAGAPRFELSTFEHDRLGQLVAMTRYRNPASASEGVRSSFRLDSQQSVRST